MKKINRFVAGVFALAAIVGSFGSVPAFAAGPNTCLWTGATDTKFSTATNWSGCGGVAPQAGDIIAFNNSATAATLTNDLSVALGGVQMQGGASYRNYTIDTLKLAAGATILDQSTTGTTYLYISGTVTGLGDVTLSSTSQYFGLSGGDWNVAGTISVNNVGPSIATVQGGTLSMGGLSSSAVIGGTQVNGATVNTAEAFTFATTGTPSASLNFNAALGSQTYNLTGPVTLNSNGTVCAGTGATVTFTGALTPNQYTLTKDTSASCQGTVNFNWSNAASLAGAKSSVPKAPNTGKVGISQTSTVAPIFGAVLVAAGIMSVRYIATRKR